MTGQSTARSITPASTGAISAAPGDTALGLEPPRAQRRLLRGTRPLKRWRYVAVFCDDVMACAALVQIGPARQSFWALYDRRSGELRERTRMLPGAREVALEHGRAGAPGGGPVPGRVRIADRGVELDLELEEVPGIQALCDHGGAEVWTRKQAGIQTHGTLSLDGGPPQSLRGRAVVDDTAGHHARVTEWRWSAGVGETPDGHAVGWNLVSGVNDPANGSERAVWVGGEAYEPGPVTFAQDLSEIAGAGGEVLRFTPEAERSRRDNLVIVRSSYRAPFGTFSGTLPGGVPLARGSGVMEHHRARW